jgi:hypothetical protein
VVNPLLYNLTITLVFDIVLLIFTKGISLIMWNSTNLICVFVRIWIADKFPMNCVLAYLTVHQTPYGASRLCDR